MRFSKGVHYSTALHGLLLFLAIFGIPSILHRDLEPEPEAISVEILPIAPVSNIRPQEKTPEKPEEKKPKEEKRTERKPTPETKKEAAPKPEETVPAPSPKKAAPEKKAPEKKAPKPDESLDSILKSVKDTAKAEAAKHPVKESVSDTSKKQAVSQNYNPDLPLSMSEKDAIREHFHKFWNIPAGAKDSYNLAVTLHIEVMEDGSVAKVELARDASRYESDSFFRAAVDAAMRAVQRGNPIPRSILPPEKYSTWRDMELSFDPKDMLY